MVSLSIPFRIPVGPQHPAPSASILIPFNSFPDSRALRSREVEGRRKALSIPFRIPEPPTAWLGWLSTCLSFNSFPDSSRMGRTSGGAETTLSIPFRIPDTEIVSEQAVGAVYLSIPFRIPEMRLGLYVNCLRSMAFNSFPDSSAIDG